MHGIHHKGLELERVGVGEGADVLRRIGQRGLPGHLEENGGSQGRRHVTRHGSSVGEDLTASQLALLHNRGQLVKHHEGHVH